MMCLIREVNSGSNARSKKLLLVLILCSEHMMNGILILQTVIKRMEDPLQGHVNNMSRYSVGMCADGYIAWERKKVCSISLILLNFGTCLK
jgi:hypothetical protein